MRIPVEILIPRYKDHLFWRRVFCHPKPGRRAGRGPKNTFIRYHQSSQAFDGEEHIRLWLFRTVYNQAKDIRKSFWKRNKVSLDEVVDAYYPAPSSHRDLFEAVLRLPEKQRSAMQLYYYEDYSIKEIAAILGCKEAPSKTAVPGPRHAQTKASGGMG